MGDVLCIPFRCIEKAEIYRLEECAGCQCAIDEEEGYTRIVLPYNDRKEHIALCPSCTKQARGYGVI